MPSVTPRRPAETKVSVPQMNSDVPNARRRATIRRYPLLPTMHEALLLEMYPATLLLGSIFSVLNPATRAAPYDTSAKPYVCGSAPFYFAQKTNLFNTLFVKRGWFWITASYFLFLFTHPSTGPPRSPTMTLRRMRGIARWGIVTLWWFFVTQWFFGPPIIDRSFTLTGGQCELLAEEKEGTVHMGDAREFVTALACKAVGGKWKGGHDISGHVFLLVLGSMFLLQEALHAMRLAANKPEERTILTSDGTVKGADEDIAVGPVLPSESNGNSGLGVKFLLGIAALSVWMLLMTAIYFHTWFEKVCDLPHPF